MLCSHGLSAHREIRQPDPNGIPVRQCSLPFEPLFCGRLGFSVFLNFEAARFRMNTITNIAAYKFASLIDLKPLRERLIRDCKQWGLKGTILLSPEGINLFTAGARPDIDKLLAELRAVPGLESLEVKFSESDHQPFHRMLVKIKREIIAFGVEGIEPVRNPAPRIAARELKQWLDEGRPVTLLDTRNDYEVKLGTFRNAKVIGIQHFRNFPDAVRRLPAELKQQPIVTFCTGGIRCEKAAPFMIREGFEQIYQLDGGILKYFEECGAAHYDGECFVFDQRVGVDPTLHETESAQCHACQTPLTATDQLDTRYVAGKSCPYCYRSTEEQRAAWEAFNKAMGNERYALEWCSYREAAEAGVKAMMTEADKLMSHPSVKQAFEHFILMCELTKEQQNGS